MASPARAAGSRFRRSPRRSPGPPRPLRRRSGRPAWPHRRSAPDRCASTTSGGPEQEASASKPRVEAPARVGEVDEVNKADGQHRVLLDLGGCASTERLVEPSPEGRRRAATPDPTARDRARTPRPASPAVPQGVRARRRHRPRSRRCAPGVRPPLAPRAPSAQLRTGALRRRGRRFPRRRSRARARRPRVDARVGRYVGNPSARHRRSATACSTTPASRQSSGQV